MKFDEALLKIKPACIESAQKAKEHWNSLVKPLHSLGLLEEAIIKIAGVLKTERVQLDKKCVAVMCADNGVIAQGVTQSDQEVTAIVTENFSKGLTSVCLMAKTIGADIFPIDIGVYRDINVNGIINKKVMYGTNDMTVMPAMSKEQVLKAIEVGIDTVIELKEKGYKIIATGEMGIGNTTTSSALASLLLSQPIEAVTGYGAGLGNEGLKRKISAIKRAIDFNKPDTNDAIDMLSKVGGLDIAGMVGLYIGGAVASIPIVIDGVISAVAALLASKINPTCKEYMIPSHVSKEPAGKLLLEVLDFKPLITCEMCLGEGTGAISAIGLIEMALSVYNGMCKFEDTAIEKYEDLLGKK